VTGSLRTPTSRIALAIALSALAHAIALLAPLVRLPPAQAPLPPLTAKLEPLPRTAARPAPPKKPKPRPRPVQPVATEPPPINRPGDEIPQEEQPPADAVQRLHEPNEPPVEEVQETPPAHPLPRQAELVFVAYKGADLPVGEMRHRLEIDSDKRYTLKVGMSTTGLASLFKRYESEQQSSGTLTPHGLRPARYSETKRTSGGEESAEASFAWNARVLSFSGGNSLQLPEQAQDIVSFLYQLSQLPLDKGMIPMHISNGRKLERYELVVGEEEMIQTRLGRLRALPVRKARKQGEEGLEVWLGLEYRLLPVKIRLLDRSGQIAGEMVVAEIRVADEPPAQPAN